MVLLKCWTLYAGKFGKVSSGHRIGKVSIHYNPEKGPCQRMFKLPHKVMFKILQGRLQQYVNWELPDIQAGFRKDRGTRNQIANIQWIIEKAREFQKTVYFCFIDYTKAFDHANHNKLRTSLKEMGISDHLTCLLWNVYAGQVQRTGMIKLFSCFWKRAHYFSGEDIRLQYLHLLYNWLDIVRLFLYFIFDYDISLSIALSTFTHFT